MYHPYQNPRHQHLCPIDAQQPSQPKEVHRCAPLPTQIKELPKEDPYTYYVGQHGYTSSTCQDQQSINPYAVCYVQPKGIRETDNYLSLATTHSERLTACHTIVPSYYPDMTFEMIGKRPVYTGRYCEYQIPEIITRDKSQLLKRDFAGIQPFWCPSCM